MDRASSLIYPGSRTLVSWWRQLQSQQPQALWIGYEFVHRVEAPVYIQSTQPIEPLHGMLLRAIALEQRINGVSVASLHQRLQVPTVIVRRMLIGMQEIGLIHSQQLEDWKLTELGHRTLETNHLPIRFWERRVFPFIERLEPSGQRNASPMYIPLADCVGAPWQVEPQHRFAADFLRAFIAQTNEQKQAVEFPSEIDALADDASIEIAQQVLVDRPQRIMLAFIQTSERLLGFAVKVDGWTLHDREPVLRMPIASRSNWPELAQEIPLTTWQDAWRSWCRQRQLPTNEVDACTLTYRAPRLEVQAPPRLVQRLHAAKSDLFKNEAWLLVGDGYLRTAALLALK